MSEPRRISITGMSVNTPLGDTPAAFADGLARTIDWYKAKA